MEQRGPAVLGRVLDRQLLAQRLTPSRLEAARDESDALCFIFHVLQHSLGSLGRSGGPGPGTLPEAAVSAAEAESGTVLARAPHRGAVGLACSAPLRLPAGAELGRTLGAFGCERPGVSRGST